MVSVSPGKGKMMDKYSVLIHDLQTGTYTVVVTNVGFEEALGQLKWCLTKGTHNPAIEVCIREV